MSQLQTETANAERVIAGHLVRNTILQRIPVNEFEALRPHLRFTTLQLATALQIEYLKIRFACFVNSGIASLLVQTDDGRSVEVGIAGREDMIGLPLVAGLSSYSHSVIMQVPGEGFVVEGGDFQRLLLSSPGLKDILVRRLGIRSLQLAQNAACNRLHNVKQRVARWLLAVHDRIDSDTVLTTHDFLAKMVGTDRPSVSIAIAQLEQSGIRRGRASIHIACREHLEGQACECYAALQRFDSELGLYKKLRRESD